MCGIAGFFSNERYISGDYYYNAHSKMDNRGPDDEGFIIFDSNYTEELYGSKTINDIKVHNNDIRKLARTKSIMSHVRLSILDLSAGGHQPFTDKQKVLSMVFNGEIYNFIELRNELKELGWDFQTSTDTEVLFKAYQQWGEECFNKLNGMWAVAFYDSINKKLVLSRDRFGVKPLFYRVEGSTIVFASEIKVITSLFDKNYINKDCVKKYLDRSILSDDENTLFSDIYEVQPGGVVSFLENKKIQTKKYWNYYPSLKNYSADEAVEYFGYLFQDSIKLRMRSDVEIGSLLSGGLDSNLIAGTLFQSGINTSDYKTFSSVYKEKQFSEQEYIENTVKKYGVKADYLYITAEEVMNSIDDALYNLEMPTRAVPMMLQYLLYKRISGSSDVKVVLNGQGADELFGGYNVDYITRFLHLAYNCRFKDLTQEIKEYKRNRFVGIKPIIGGMIGQSHIEHTSRKNAFNEISFHQITETPLREYLMYDDRAAMSFGIENRAPFLDYRLVEFAFSLDSDYKVNKVQNKSVVRDYARAKENVDLSILNRKDKMGFTSPQEIWQKREWKEGFDKAFLEIKNNGIVGYDGHYYYDLYKRYKESNEIDWAVIWRIYCLHRWSKVVSKWTVTW